MKVVEGKAMLYFVPDKREKQIYPSIPLFAFHGRCGKQKQHNPFPHPCMAPPPTIV